jgi:hypothetical protein
MRNSRLLSVFVLLLFALPLHAAEFYVSTDGANDPANGSEGSPFRTITYALSVADTTDGSPHTIYVENGRYSSHLEVYPLPIIDNISIVGEERDRTILDASASNTSVMAAIDVSNWTLENLTITGGREIQGGGILATLGSNATLKNLHITENSADYSIVPGTIGEGGGVFLYEIDNVLIENVLFSLNYAVERGGAIMVTRCSPVLDKVSIHHNNCSDDPTTSAIYSDGVPGNEVVVKNSIIWGNPGGNGDVLSINGDLDVTYSLVENVSGAVYPGTGNIHVEPLFTDFEERDYSVLEGSETVDKGDPSSDYSLEPAPNGEQVNLGYLANTDETVISGSQYELRRDRWNFIGIPVDAGNGDPSVLFGDDLDNASTGSDTWRFMRWNNVLDIFFRYGEPESDGVERGNPPAVEPGIGYLIRQSMYTRRTIDVPGYAIDQDPSTTYNLDLEAGDPFNINMIANPYPYSINYMDLLIDSQSMEVAAQNGFINRWMYVLNNDGKFVPNLGVLDPWEGAIIVTLDDNDSQLQYTPVRNEADYGEELSELDWGLYLSVAATDSNGDPLAIDGNHIFGVGRESQYISDGVDAYDAYSFDLLANPLTFHWELEDGTALYHDMRKGADDYYPMWHGVINGVSALQDSVLIFIEGVENDTLEANPGLEYGLQLRRDTDEREVLIENLRDSTTFKLPFDTLSDGSKVLSFYIYATHPDWIENSVEDEELTVPKEFRVESVYPNPFNASTSVVFSLHRQGDVSLKVFDVLGREVAKQSMKAVSAGRHRINWTPNNVASGVYFMQLQAAGITEVKKVVLVR